MNKCISHSYLAHKGHIVKPGEELYLDDHQVEKLGDKVQVISEDDQDGKAEQAEDNQAQEQDAQDDSSEAKESLNDMKVSELREMAKDQDIEGYSSMKKAELIDALEE